MHYAIINDQYIPVRDELVDTLRSDLLAAVRQGGGFLTFGDAAPYRVEILVTPQTPVRIRPVRPPVTPSARPSEIPKTDLEWWLEWGS